ncbi:MAG: RND transporter, partial [Paraburkholderia sp.]
MFPISLSRPLLRRSFVVMLMGALLSACSTLPPYQRPTAEIPAKYAGTAPGWAQAAPADATPRGPWWTIFN